MFPSKSRCSHSVQISILNLLLLTQSVCGRSFAPSSRAITPRSVHSTTGSVTKRADISAFTFTLSGPNATVTYDFGAETAGLPSFQFHATSCDGSACLTTGLPALSCPAPCQGLGLAYSETTEGIGLASDLSTINTAQDGTVFLPIVSNQMYTPPIQWARGGFRYLTISLGPGTSTATSVTVGVKQIQYTAAPDLAEEQLGAYTGTFESSDKLLDDIWNAGANTLQLCTISANSSVQHVYVALGGGWAQNSQVTGLKATDVILSDGAKRDRNPWAGDMSIAMRAALMSQNYDGLKAVRNTLFACIELQDKTLTSATYGYFPYAGSPLGDLLILAPQFIAPYGSDTYHLFTISSFAEYVLLTRDTVFLAEYWQQILVGINATYDFVQSDGLFNGTRTADWGRVGQGGKNSALNALYYQTLRNLVKLCKDFPSQTSGSQVAKWTSMAAQLKISFNEKLWDSHAGLYRDNNTAAGADVFPQDGNSFAVQFGLTDSASMSTLVTEKLASRLTSFGAPAPELPGSISPYIGSHELMAQFHAAEQTGDPTAALSLMKTQWGYMRKAFSNTTFIEGYASNGALDYGFYSGAPTFISLAHAWSSGPVYSLIHDVAGIRATSLDVVSNDGSWAIKPTGALSYLSYAKASIVVPRGSFSAAWSKSRTGFQMEVTAPAKLAGTIYLPLFGRCAEEVEVMVNGRRFIKGEVAGPFLRLGGIAGGKISVLMK